MSVAVSSARDGEQQRVQRSPGVSKQTRNNWLIDIGLFLGAVIAMVSGIYFLYLPDGGYRGGRNPTYGINILFDRHTWEELHLWGGLAMIAISLVHVVLHWSWLVNMTRRTWAEFIGRRPNANLAARSNYALNATTGVSFLITAVTGLYLYFVPHGKDVVDPAILFVRTTWDLIHTWAGVVLTAAATLHIAIHWRWLVKVSQKVAWGLTQRKAAGGPVRVTTTAGAKPVSQSLTRQSS